MFNLFELNNLNDFVYLLNQIGEDVRINKKLQRGLITNTGSKTLNEKYITALDPLFCGDLIKYDDKSWLITSEIAGKRYHKFKGVMKPLNEKIAVYSSEYFYNWYPCMFSTKTINVKTNQIIQMAVNEMLITMQENDDSRGIELNHYFPKWGKKWTIQGIDRSIKGLITLHAKRTLEDMQEPEQEIEQNEWYITITCEPDLFYVFDKDWNCEIEVSKTGTLVATVYNSDGEEQEYETVTWSLNEGVNATINSETGEFAASEGEELVTATAVLDSNGKVTESVLIHVFSGGWW